jgi:hypothetical protein
MPNIKAHTGPYTTFPVHHLLVGSLDGPFTDKYLKEALFQSSFHQFNTPNNQAMNKDGGDQESVRKYKEYLKDHRNDWHKFRQ